MIFRHLDRHQYAIGNSASSGACSFLTSMHLQSGKWTSSLLPSLDLSGLTMSICQSAEQACKFYYSKSMHKLSVLAGTLCTCSSTALQSASLPRDRCALQSWPVSKSDVGPWSHHLIRSVHPTHRLRSRVKLHCSCIEDKRCGSGRFEHVRGQGRGVSRKCSPALPPFLQCKANTWMMLASILQLPKLLADAF